MEIRIRHAEPEDYKDLQEVYSQPKAIEGTLQIPFPPETLWKNRLLDKPDNMYVLVGDVEGKVIAGLGLHVEKNVRRRHVGAIGMAVHDEWHRRGVGSALLNAALELSDNWLNLTRIELNVFTDNEAAIALYQKYGFVREGILRNYAFRSGSYEDVVAMARLKIETKKS